MAPYSTNDHTSWDCVLRILTPTSRQSGWGAKANPRTTPVASPAKELPPLVPPELGDDEEGFGAAVAMLGRMRRNHILFPMMPPRSCYSSKTDMDLDFGVILVNMVISVILGHEKTKIQNIIDLGKIDVFSVKTIIHNNNKKMGHLIWPLGV